jgi:hypothetical protein
MAPKPSILTMPRIQVQPIVTPRVSSVSRIAAQDLSSHVISGIFAVWKSHAGDRDMPTRDHVLPKPMAAYMRHISLLRWLPEDDDYEFRFVGDAHVQAYAAASPPGLRMSTVIAGRPEFGNELKRSFDVAREQRAPLALRGFIGTEFADARFVWFETLYLPLRGNDDAVEYVMNAAVYQPRDGAWPS